MKQITMVYEALLVGPANSQEIADEIGLSKKAVSAYLSDLASCGFIEKFGDPVQPDHQTKQGRKAHGRPLQTWAIAK